MNVNFEITSPSDWASKSLDARSNAIRLPAQNKWATQRTPWARVISSAVINDDSSIRNKYSLYSGKLDTFEHSYDVATNRPKFGLTSIDVDYKGPMGSTRSCTIQFQCWTLEDLEKMEQLYMVPGMSVIVEWGWSISSAGAAVYPINDFTKSPTLNPKFMPWVMEKVFKHREACRGDYDGLVGLVTNFNYKINESLGYDCSFELTSPGDMWLDMDSGAASKNEVINDNGKQKKMSNLESAFNRIYKDLKALPAGIFQVGLNDEANAKLDAANKVKNYVLPLIVNQVWRTETREFDKQHATISETIDINVNGVLSSAEGTIAESCEVYVSWPKFVSLINENVNFFFDQTNKNNKDPETQHNMPKLGNSLVPITILPKMMSADPRVCIFKPIDIDPVNGRSRMESLAEQEIYQEDPASTNEKSTWVSTTLNYISKGIQSISNGVSNMRRGATTSAEIPTSIPSIPALDELYNAQDQINALGDSRDVFNVNIVNKDFTLDPYVGLLNNVYINAAYVRDTLMAGEKLSLQDFLTTILTDLNNSSGGIWDLRFHVDPSDETRIQIYDANYTSTQSRKKNLIVPYEFNITDLLVRNVELETNLIAGYKDMALYSNTTDTDSSRSTGMRLYSDTIIRDGFIPKDVKATRSEPESGDFTGYEEDDVDAAYYALLDGVDDESVSSAKNSTKAYIEYINRYRKDIAKYLPVNQNILLPFNFTLQLDGFSGLEWGNAITFDRIPKRYKDKIYFQTVKVKHTINDKEWITDIETKMRIKNDDTEINSAPSKTNTYANTNAIRNEQLQAGNSQFASAGSLSTGANQTSNVYQNNPSLQIKESPAEAAKNQKATQDFFNKKKGARP